MLLIGIALPNFPVSVPILVLVERRHCCSNFSGVRLVSNFFATGLLGDGVFLVGSESDESDIDVSHSNWMSAIFVFYVGLRELVSLVWF